MFDKETMQIVEILKAVPDSKSEDDLTMKSYTNILAEAAQRGISQYVLDSGLRRLPTQGLAAVYRSPNGSIRGVMPTKMFRNLFM